MTSPNLSKKPSCAKKRCVIIWRDLGNYHIARAAALAANPNLAVSVVEITSRSEYPEFKAAIPTNGNIDFVALGISSPIQTPLLRARLNEVLTKLRPDVVFAPGWSAPEALIAIEWASDHDVRCVIMSESLQEDHRRWPVRERLKKRIASLGQAGFVGGRGHASYLTSLGIERHNIYDGYDVVDNDHFERGAEEARKSAPSLRAELNLPENYFLCCGRLVAKKNIANLVEAFALYRRISPDRSWHLVIVGPGPLSQQLSELATRLGVNQYCHLVGAKGYDELPAIYGLAGAFVLPSLIEPWGLVVNEAMAAGLPILISDRCGCREELLVEGKNGYSFDPVSVEGLSAALDTMSGDSCDRIALGIASREIIQQWAPARFLQGFEAAATAALLEKPSQLGTLDRLLLRISASR